MSLFAEEVGFSPCPLVCWLVCFVSKITLNLDGLPKSLVEEWGMAQGISFSREYLMGLDFEKLSMLRAIF